MTDESAQKNNNLLKTQLSMFSIIPIESTQEDVEYFCKRFWTVPLSGLVLGVILGIIFLISTYLFTLFPAAIITVFMGYILNRFLHFDGLMDFGDGLVAHGDQEKKTKALKDTNVGAGGVGVGIMVSFLTVIALESATGFIGYGNHFYWQLAVFMFPVCMEVLAKNSLYIAAAFGEANSNGLGSMFVKSANRDEMIKSIILSAVIVIPLFTVVMFSTPLGLIGAILVSAIMVLISVAVGYLVSSVAMKSFGYVNGDVLGAANELGRVGVLLAALMMMRIFSFFWY